MYLNKIYYKKPLNIMQAKEKQQDLKQFGYKSDLQIVNGKCEIIVNPYLQKYKKEKQAIEVAQQLVERGFCVTTAFANAC